MRRHDDDVEILGGSSASRYIVGTVTVSRISLPSSIRIYARNTDNTPALDSVLISIDITNHVLE